MEEPLLDRHGVLQQLERVLSSSVFRRAERSSALLRFIVEQTLDGQADRIAMVNSASSRTLELPLHLLGQGGAIRLIAEPIGDDTRYTTDILTVQPGQMVELNVENPIARSNYSIQ